MTPTETLDIGDIMKDQDKLMKAVNEAVWNALRVHTSSSGCPHPPGTTAR